MEAVIARRPAQEKFLLRGLSVLTELELGQTEAIARDVLHICGAELPVFAQHYVQMCDALLREEFYFRRHGRYRNSTFAQADAEVYSNEPFMRMYVQGILLSQILWSNHVRVLLFLEDQLAALCPSHGSYLEIGPGHGLCLCRAIRALPRGAFTSWDVSPTSCEETRRALRRLGVADQVTLRIRNILSKPPSERYDFVVVSEVLEHLECPAVALENLTQVLAPKGLLYINMPVNCPAPDHLYLLRNPRDFAALIRSCGLEIVASTAAPMTGYTLSRALDEGVTISCAALARRAV